jgi:serine/threonine protein kinase
MALEPGYLLNNRYRIIEILGQGGMGSVYRARDENLNVDVAVKDNFFTTDEYARQFHREAIILAGLRQSNLPRVTDHFVIPGQGQYLVMDYIAGEDLRQRMDRLGLLPEDEVIKVGAAICDALSYLSSCVPPIIHRDIKPGNVKIDPQGQIFLVDFGLAKILYGSQMTTTGARAMTPGYSPPEQYGTARTDHRSDIYSLGATLYAALTGCIPEDALSRAMDQVALTTVRKLNPHISRRLSGVIERALEVRPDDRYQSADEFKDALLKANPSTRRNQLGYTLPPPPLDANGMPAFVPSGDGSAPFDVDSAGINPATGGYTSPSLPLERPAANRTPSRPRRRRRLPRMLAISVVILAVLGVVLLAWSNPGFAGRALGLIWASPTATASATLPPPTPTELLVVATQPSPTATPTATLPPSPTPTITLTPTPTRTPQPTRTPIPTIPPPFPGGGSGQFAYASIRIRLPQIFLRNFENGVERQLTNMVDGACQPHFSPDGKQLIFISPCDPQLDPFYHGAQLFIIPDVDAATITPIPIASQLGGDYDPSWSPDGTTIVFTSERNGRRPQVFKLILSTGEVIPLSAEFDYSFQPDWSPDGSQIVFINRVTLVNQIWQMDANGGNQEAIYLSPGSPPFHPVWSPDGDEVMFTQYVSNVPKLAAIALGATDGESFPIGQPIHANKDAAYSPDGVWILFESWERGGIHDIYIMTANGAGREKVTDDPYLDMHADWRP